MNFIKQLRKSSFFPFLRKLYRKIKRIPRHPIQDSKTIDGFDIIHLGTEYGGWSFVDDDSLKGCTIISAGLGEDASFDIEFAKKYDAKVIIIDPTPRAIKHFSEIQNALGKQATQKYVDSGCQPVSSYDLSNLNKDNFTFIDKALWNENTSLKFFSPPNPNNVSHSINNYQNNYATDTAYIDVNAITLDSILNDLKLKVSDVPLIKLDIESAEIEVLKRCMEIEILPRQILVEFDELNEHKGFARITETDELLKSNGYILLKTDGVADFLYFKK
jgi:FkbM family methyltransferase